MCDVEDMHEAEIAADVDDVGNGSSMAQAQLKCSPATNATIDEDAQGGQTEGEEIDKCEQPDLEDPGKQAQIGEAKQDERSDSRIIRRAEDGGEDACYEKNLSHFLKRATGMPICSRYLLAVRRATLKPSA